MDNIYARMNDDTESFEKIESPSEIQRSYSGKTILLTDCASVLGKCLVEKILRTCWSIDRLYLLTRRQEEVEEEDEEDEPKEYFDNVVFETLRRARPDFQQQVSFIEGDLSLPGVGLSAEDRRTLIESVDMIVHNGDISTCPSISTLLKVNVLGTKEMLDLAKECHHLEAFVYVSSAYTHCYEKTIEEKYCTPPAGLQMVYDMIKVDTENKTGLSKEASRDMLNPYPNAHVFSKAVAETIVHDYAATAPFACGIFRASSVISTYKEPIQAWCEDTNDLALLFSMLGVGMTRVVYSCEHGAPDMVPADMTSNACLLALWDLAKNRENPKETRVFNFATSAVKPMKYDVLCEKAYPFIKAAPTENMIWLPCMNKFQSYCTYRVAHLLIDYSLAILADLGRQLESKGTKYFSILQKHDERVEQLRFFMERNWKIKTSKVLELYDSLSLMDRKLFFCDLRQLDWDEYATTYWQGVRAYVLHDPMTSLEAATSSYNRKCWVYLILLIVAIYWIFRRAFA